MLQEVFWEKGDVGLVVYQIFRLHLLQADLVLVGLQMASLFDNVPFRQSLVARHYVNVRRKRVKEKFFCN